MTSVHAHRPAARSVEAQRNRERLIAAAVRAFASSDGSVSLEAIAREAGVGIGTLYRHFPQRAVLVAAVYEDQVARLNTSAHRLLVRHAPAQALRRWLPRLLDWAATKHGMIDTLGTLLSSGKLEQTAMRTQLIDILALFLDAGARAGDMRADAAAGDVAALIAGVLVVAGAPDQRAQAARMLDLVVDGLRPECESSR